MTALTPPIGYFGSKVKVAPRIVDLLPPHRGYVEPYAGSPSVLLAKMPAPFEVVNDIDQDLVTFWRVLRDQPEDLTRVCSLTPHSRVECAAAWPCLKPCRVTTRGLLWSHGPRRDRCAWSGTRMHWPIARITRGRPMHVAHLPERRCA